MFVLLQVAVLSALLLAITLVWSIDGRGRWRSLVTDRLLYGLPWGTLLTVALIVAFYLLTQNGFRQWSEPLILPFVSWSYLYPTGIFVSGFAHASPAHLGSNMIGTLVFGSLAEYAWGHYPPNRQQSAPTRGAFREIPIVGGLLARPPVRAFVLFPAVLLGAGFITALFAAGPGLGFSGAVFAVLGFSVVTRPRLAVVGVALSAALQPVFGALNQPVVRATTDPGAPGPPAWAGIGFQAHLFGFLLGVLLAIGLLWYRRRQPSTDRIFFGTLIVGLAQTLWLISWPGGEDTFVLYQGAGVILVCLLTLVITVAVTGGRRSDSTRGRSLRAHSRSSRLQSAPDSIQTVGRLLGVLTLLGLAVLIAFPSLFIGLVTVADDSVQGSEALEVSGYTVTYSDNATSGRTFPGLPADNETTGGQSGVIVANPDRQLWTMDTTTDVLEHDGNTTVTVGGFGWHERIAVDRTGWDVVGNESAYAVDFSLEGDPQDDRTRAFTTDPITANAVIDGATVAVVPTAEAFELRVTRDGSTVGETTIPERNETATAGGLTFETEATDETDRVVATADGSTAQIAQRETD